MKPSKRIRIIVFFTALLFSARSSSAQRPDAPNWGPAVDGLQMRIYPDQTAAAQSSIPKLRVEFRNVGGKDLLLNLGIMTGHGAEQYPTAVSLILVDAQGTEEWLELKRPRQINDARNEPLLLPLPVGAIFSFGVDLENYWTPTLKESAYTRKPGTYLLAAHLAGFRQTDPLLIRGDLELQPIARRRFDAVNPPVGLGPLPISNTLKFQVPSR